MYNTVNQPYLSPLVFYLSFKMADYFCYRRVALLFYCLLPFYTFITSDAEIIYQNSIQLLDSSMETITVLQGQEPADIVYKFGWKHGLDRTHREYLLQQICSSPQRNKDIRINCSRDKAVIFSTPVSSEENVFIANFDLLEDEEPVDAAQTFVTAHKLGVGYRNAILKEACDHVECHRIHPVLWRYTLWMQEPSSSPTSSRGTPVVIELLEGKEVADVIFETLLPWKVTREQRKHVLGIAKEQGVDLQREDALVYQQNVRWNDTNSSSATLKLWDDGTEPVDTIYQFLLQLNPQLYEKNSTRAEQEQFEQQFQLLSESVLFHVCNMLPCTRKQPRIWSHPITASHGHDIIAILEIMKDEEPIDAIDHFAIKHRLDANYRQYLFQTACKDLTCRRMIPVVFEKTIQNEHGQNIGSVQVFENEEVVDAVVRFLFKSKAQSNHHLDPIILKNTFFQLACSNPRLLCTRNVAHIFDKMIVNHDDNSPIGQLIITEFDEPADKIYDWIQQKNMSLSYFDFLIEHVCATEGVTCSRKKPIVFTLPLADPNGNLIGRLDILIDEEPVDALYKFFSRYNLFEKNWDFKALVKQICQLPAITCHRTVALKYFAENFTMGEGEEKRDVGPLIVWDNEEVIDKLYEKRMGYNLTLDDQMKSFSIICHKDDIYCSRTRAVVYKLTDITKRDYEKYGNETCDRKYAGWQYLSYFAGSSLWVNVVSFLKRPFMHAVRYHLFVSLIFPPTAHGI